MEVVAVRIEASPATALVVGVLLACVPLLVAMIWTRWRRSRGREAGFGGSFAVALGVELGVIAAAALAVSGVAAPGAFFVLMLGLPVVAGVVRSYSEAGDRIGAFVRTFFAMLGIVLAPVAVVLLFVGAACFSSSGYVEF